YDIPFLKPWFRFVGAIRVEAATFRREVPELKDAIATLDRGDCLVIFPEGAMRKREEQPLRMFGQGVVHILRERPQTPVVICWIEGAWGCYFSYFNGLPTKNKRLDRRRRIEVALEAPRLIDPALLEDQKALRRYLMEACLQARTHLRLPALTLDK